ncbi:MAG: ankyrin repeat domain-containing protein [Fimbriimonadaceae bacterium]
MITLLVSGLLVQQLTQSQKDSLAFLDKLAAGDVGAALSTPNAFGSLTRLIDHERKVDPKVMMKLSSALTRRGADPNKRLEDGGTILHFVAMHSSTSGPAQLIRNHNTYWITKAILSAPTCDPNLLDSNDVQTRDTPLTLYLRWHYERSGAFLKAMVECPKTNLNKRGGVQQQFPIHTAAFLGRLDWVKLLVEHGANIYIRKENGQTALHAAAMQDTKGNADVIRYLLMKGVNKSLKSKGALGVFQITASDANAETPLEIAKRKGFKQIIAALSEK